MFKKITELPQEKKAAIIEAVLEMAKSEPEIVLEDVNRLFLMSIEHYLMDNQELRVSMFQSYIHLHDLLAKVDMILNDKAGCHLLASGM